MISKIPANNYISGSLNKIHASASVEHLFIKKVKSRKQPLKVFHK